MISKNKHTKQLHPTKLHPNTGTCSSNMVTSELSKCMCHLWLSQAVQARKTFGLLFHFAFFRIVLSKLIPIYLRARKLGYVVVHKQTTRKSCYQGNIVLKTFSEKRRVAEHFQEMTFKAFSWITNYHGCSKAQ